MSDGRKTITIGEMLGDELTDWLRLNHEKGLLTTKKLRTKLHENSEFLVKRGVVADYAYYAIIHAMQQHGRPIPEE